MVGYYFYGRSWGFLKGNGDEGREEGGEEDCVEDGDRDEVELI